MSRRQALRALETHLEEVIGLADASTVIDQFEETVTKADLDEALALQADRLTAVWRRDLLLIMTGQFVAIAGVLTAIT